MVDQYTKRWFQDFPGQQPWQDPEYIRVFGQMNMGHPPGAQGPAPAQNQPAAQDMTPTIRTEMKQVESIDAISKNPPAPGTTGAYMTRDETAIIFRTMHANGEFTDRIYDVRPPAPPPAKFNPEEYIRKDEAEKLVRDVLAAYVAAAKAKEEK